MTLFWWLVLFALFLGGLAAVIAWAACAVAAATDRLFEHLFDDDD